VALSAEQARTFAQEWVEGWNSRDLDRILKHYAANVVFHSPRIAAVTGDKSGVVKGIDDLRRYWSKALTTAPELHFAIQQIFVGNDALTIVYRNHRDQLVAETLVFDESGMIREGIVAHAPA